MCRGLTLTQADAAPAGVVRRVEALDDDALVAGGDHLVDEQPARLGRVGGHQCGGTPAARRHAAAASRSSRSWPGESRRSSPSTCSRSKKYGVSGPAHAASRRRPAGGAGAVSWNGRGRPVGVERDRLAVEDQGRCAGSARDRLDHLGQPGGDVVEAAGEHADLVAVLVHLDPDAVELGVDGDTGPSPALSSAAATSGALEASIGRTGRPGCSPNSRERLDAPGERGGRDRRRGAGEHRGPAYGGGGHVRGRGRPPRASARRARPAAARR